MDHARKERLTAGGIQVEDAVARLMGNEMLLERFLQKFAADTRYYDALCAADEAGDMKAMLEASHALKGLCGNLSMRTLFDLFSRQVEALRAGKWESAAALMPEIRAAYAKAVDAIGEG